MMQLINIILFAIFSSPISPTEQQPDLLLHGKDTLYLKSYPLESLQLKFHPFGYTRATAPTTACWRGYVATWIILENRLYLKNISHCYGDRESRDIDLLELFQKNGISYKAKDKMILANWYSKDLYRMRFTTTDKIYLHEGNLHVEKDHNLIFRIDQGQIIKSRLE